MKTILIILLSFCGCLCLQAQVFIGVRDTRYIQAGFQFSPDVYLTFEQSVYSENYRYQKSRLYAGYTHSWSKFALDANLYGSTLWNGGYKDVGAHIRSEYKLLKPLAIDATINPHYDT